MADSTTRWDPFRDLVSIQDELNQPFGRTFGGEQTYHRVEEREETKPRKIEVRATA